MADQIFMDTDAVEQMAKRFESVNQTLGGLARTLDALTNTLKSTAMQGAPGDAAAGSYESELKPLIDALAKKCVETGGDLTKSVQAYRNGDAQGSARFH